MADFNSFGDVAIYLQNATKKLEDSRKKALRAVGEHLKKEIKGMHGVRQPGWLVSKNNPDSPLLKTGALRDAVSYRTENQERVILYSKKAWLAIIHEFGVTYRMTEKQRKYLFAFVFNKEEKTRGRPRKTWGSGMINIPARPIWRKVLSNEQIRIQSIIDEYLEGTFT